ncbi:MAG: hypothetical protein KDE31_15445, partial [Caldilineaceae bacterium]|nr:hypothetical protein [Caldilineaceae bacterium]
LWGFSGGPTAMTGDGKDLFVNAVVFGLGRRCQQPQEPPAECITLFKTAEPADGTTVNIGDVITYRLQYTVKDNPACASTRAILEDPIPP